MRTTNTEYMFSKTEIRILGQLTKGKQSLSEIGKALSLKPARLSQNLKRLQEKGLIQKTGQGNSKVAYFNDTKHALLLRDLLLSFGHINWENMLTDKTIELLFQTLIPSETSPAKFSETTRWRQLKNLKTRGIITQEGKILSINPRFSILINFLTEYEKFLANKLSKAISEDSVILWQKDMEFLIRAPKKTKPTPDNFLKTATSILQEYDLPLFSDFDIYYYSTSKNKIRPEDAILHTLLLEPSNVRYTTYALLLLKKAEKQIDKAYLLKEAERFGLKNLVNAMLQFLETHTRPKNQPLPTWNEFIAKANDYAVTT